MSHKLITVFGATDAQGSSVLRSLSQNTITPFRLRGTTRNPSFDASKALLTQVSGLDLVQADGWDKASMVAAFRDAWGAFVNTNSDDPVFENPEETRTEVDLGRLIVDAAVEAGIEVFVYSGLNSAREITGGKGPNKAFDDKHAIGKYVKFTGASKAVVLASPGWYFETFLNQELAPVFGDFPYIPSEDGTYVLRYPRWGGKEDVLLISIAEDYGDIVHGIFLEPEKWDGKLVQGVSDIKSFNEVIAAFERATGKTARFDEVPKWQNLEVYGIRALETVKLMFGFCQESGARYFGEVTEAETASQLKRSAREACGRRYTNAHLSTTENFFKRGFKAQ
ncbi:NAD(P)-binding protein [Setomelanomma holmii]|uniref:NAD(P)-binding protein n=1 Tax=Setomelanomma holmii TaxID=210430 RepID=A0A9P4H5K9_9PLEO|nr:NAD(P)-binding protein [Setomelanomma holmii]